MRSIIYPLKLIESNKIFTTLTVKGASWANKEGRVINMIDLKSIAKV